MATTTFIESGTAATQDFSFWTSNSALGGTISSSSQAILSSVRSIAAAVSGINQGPNVYQGGILADAGRRISFGFRFTGTLGADVTGADFADIRTSGGVSIFDLTLHSSGNIKLVNAGTGSVYATGSTVLTADTDYRISIVYTITSTTVNTITIYVNGISEIAVSNVTLPGTGSDRLYLTQGADNGVNTNVTFYFAHIFVDNGTSGDPGNIRVTAKRPFSNGTTNGYTTQIGSGGSGYGTGHAPQVNERPLSTTNGWSMVGAGSAVTEEYNIENAATGDNNLTGATIVDYTGWLYSSSLASETAKIIVNNVQTNISLTSSNTLFTQIAGSTTYPAGTGTDIGQITATTLTTVSLYECGIIIAYIPGVVSSATYGTSRLLMGVGS